MYERGDSGGDGGGSGGGAGGDGGGGSGGDGGGKVYQRTSVGDHQPLYNHRDTTFRYETATINSATSAPIITGVSTATDAPLPLEVR